MNDCNRRANVHPTVCVFLRVAILFLAMLFSTQIHAGVWIFKITTKNGKPVNPMKYEDTGIFIASTEAAAWEKLRYSYEYSGSFSLIQGCPGSGWMAYMEFRFIDDGLTIPFAGACGMRSRDAALKAAIASCVKKSICKKEMNAPSRFFSVVSFQYTSDKELDRWYCEWEDRRFTNESRSAFCTTDSGIPGSRERGGLPSFEPLEFFREYGGKR